MRREKKKKTRYSHAPVSEVICGVTFAESELDINTLFNAQHTLSQEYPLIDIAAPIGDEALVGFVLASELEPTAVGPFRLRLRSSDLSWLCQIQFNKIYFNWIRQDDQPVGNYPGYTEIVGRFRKILDSLGALSLANNLDLVKYLDLTYHDRIEWQKYMDSISEADKILRFSPPQLMAQYSFNNVFSRYTYDCPEIGGYGILGMNTDSAQNGIQLLKFESCLRGKMQDITMDKWFDRANGIQYDQFTNIFKEETLKKWI